MQVTTVSFGEFGVRNVKLLWIFNRTHLMRLGWAICHSNSGHRDTGVSKMDLLLSAYLSSEVTQQGKGCTRSASDCTLQACRITKGNCQQTTTCKLLQWERREVKGVQNPFLYFSPISFVFAEKELGNCPTYGFLRFVGELFGDSGRRWRTSQCIASEVSVAPKSELYVGTRMRMLFCQCDVLSNFCQISHVHWTHVTCFSSVFVRLPPPPRSILARAPIRWHLGCFIYDNGLRQMQLQLWVSGALVSDASSELIKPSLAHIHHPAILWTMFETKECLSDKRIQFHNYSNICAMETLRESAQFKFMLLERG